MCIDEPLYVFLSKELDRIRVEIFVDNTSFTFFLYKCVYVRNPRPCAESCFVKEEMVKKKILYVKMKRGKITSARNGWKYTFLSFSIVCIESVRSRSDVQPLCMGFYRGSISHRAECLAVKFYGRSLKKKGKKRRRRRGKSAESFGTACVVV